MKIICAQPEDAATLTRITHSAKRHWGYPERWIECWRNVLTIQPAFITGNQTFMARLGDRVAGFYSLSLAGTLARLEHLWVLPEFMRRGVGRALFAHALERAGALGCRELEIESDPNAEGFYQRMGARRTGVSVAEIEGQSRELPILVYDIPRGFFRDGDTPSLPQTG